MRRIYQLSRASNPRFLLAAFASGIALSMSVALLGTSAWLISMASMRPPVLVLEVAIVSVRFFGLARGFFRYFGRLEEHGSVLRLQSKLRSHLYQSFAAKLPADFFGVKRGSLLQTLVGDTETILDIWIRVASPWISAFISGIAGLGIIYFLLPSAGIVLSFIFTTTVTVVPLLSYRLSSNTCKGEVNQELVASLIEAFDTLPESILFNRVEGVKNRIAGLQLELNTIEKRSSSSAGLGDFLIQLATGISVLVALGMASHGYINHHLAGVNVAVLALLPLAIFDGLTGSPLAFSQLPSLLESAQRVNNQISLSDYEPEILNETRGKEAHISVKDFLPVHLMGKSALQEWEVAPGETLVIRGKSGIGKSSIVHALAGLTPFVGEISINGELVQSLSPNVATIGIQDDHLFQSSIRENLRIARADVTDREILQILEVVELSELIHTLPEGLDTHIGPYGHNFSGGERQRLKLARVLLRHTPIFILDEPYEFLDALQAKRIAKRVSTILITKTVIIISHLDLGINGKVVDLG